MGIVCMCGILLQLWGVSYWLETLLAGTTSASFNTDPETKNVNLRFEM